MKYWKWLYGIFIICTSVLLLGLLKTSAGTESVSERSAENDFSVSTELSVGRECITLCAYDSIQEDAWCFALPDGYEDQELTVHMVFPGNECLDVVREAGREQIEVEKDSVYYKIKFLNSGEIPSLWICTGEEDALEYLHGDKTNELDGEILLLAHSGESLIREKMVISGAGEMIPGMQTRRVIISPLIMEWSCWGWTRRKIMCSWQDTGIIHCSRIN